MKCTVYLVFLAINETPKTPKYSAVDCNREQAIVVQIVLTFFRTMMCINYVTYLPEVRKNSVSQPENLIKPRRTYLVFLKEISIIAERV